ncbi:hypothetical protein BDV96DRAFT_653028 [Lophiotrema nucula]|uniref:Cytidyltransferase-like domain-containing protein n=1 Tax=Lophiotrema nucula TaxID=690887 RepID=A0A6A5YMD3_9PLEO|nr:hypothetical protein BDV96DRAFT_653028 [Lophiotrema nucula]
MFTTTTELANIIRQAMGTKLPTDAEIFIPSKYLAPPTLTRGRTNRVLVFRGAFNPPHRGHLHTLAQAYFRAPGELNVVGAIIKVGGDDGTWSKVEGDINPLKLTMAQRQELWKDEKLVGGWHWVFPGDTDGWNDFTPRVKQVAKDAGYDLDMISVLGADHLRMSDSSWKRSFIICGGVARAEFIEKETHAMAKAGDMRQISGYEKWAELPLDPDYLDHRLGTAVGHQWLEQTCQMLWPGALIGEYIQGSDQEEGLLLHLKEALRRCGPTQKCTKKPRYIGDGWNYGLDMAHTKEQIYYIPSELVGTIRTMDVIPGESSTAIRQAIEEAKTEEELRAKLGGRVLKLDRLIEMLKEGGFWWPNMLKIGELSYDQGPLVE